MAMRPTYLGCKTAAVLASVLLLSAAITPRAAHAQNASNSAAAQGLFDAARELMKKRNYTEACPKLEESQRLDPGSGTLMNLGICYEQQGLVASAWATFLEAATSARSGGKVDRAKSAQQHADALAPRLSRLTIRVADDRIAGLEVRRDSQVVRSAQWGAAIPTDPGTHLISARAPGRKTWQFSVTLREGMTQTVSIPALEIGSGSVAATSTDVSTQGAKTPATTRSSSEEGDSSDGLGTQRVVALVAGGVGLAGVVVGSVFGLKSKSAHDEAVPLCDDTGCDPTGNDARERALAAGDISTVAFIAGGVGVAAGTILWLTAPSNVRVSVGMGSLRVEGTW
jgi:hypothetical protein